ncbi:MAG: radical SAM protein [Acidobacteria bacterium]|nr:radical SAM protein [Acidobacteriota bacterium]
MGHELPVYRTEARSILSATCGFLAEAGFTHSLTPARNCTFGCTYCYVPTMRVQGGLKPEDWRRWGQFTTYKSNAPELLRRALRPNQVIYCSPLVDPYQPTEERERVMPRILDALIDSPPAVFVVQTRGPLILRDLEELRELARRTRLRISVSITTDSEEIRRLYEPHCAGIGERLRMVEALDRAGLEVYATLAPLLPCDPERLVAAVLHITGRDIIGDPLHIRCTKRHGATTRDAARRIGARHDHTIWLDAGFQADLVANIGRMVEEAGRRFVAGPQGFGRLARN